MPDSSIDQRRADLRARLAGEAHLWLSSPEAWERKSIERTLTDDERARARTLRNPLAQQNYLVGRALVRTALSHYADIEPTAWAFESSRLGRPEITGPEPTPELRFNLSHTKDLAACLVTSAVDCGVDVEQLERRLRPLRIAEHSYAPAEFADLASRPAGELHERFLSYWTLKESYYKARGTGIPFRLGGARFELGGDSVRFLPADDERVESDGWQFWLLRPTAAHVLSVALDTGSGPRLELSCFAGSAGDTATTFNPVEFDRTRSSQETKT